VAPAPPAYDAERRESKRKKARRRDEVAHAAREERNRPNSVPQHERMADGRLAEPANGLRRLLAADGVTLVLMHAEESAAQRTAADERGARSRRRLQT